MLIVISGTPGTGKSTLARGFIQEGFFQLHVHDHYKEISTSYNRSKQCYDIDMTKFKILVQKTNKLHKKVVCDSHISHLLPKSLVDLCVVLVCPNLQKLKRRLEKRTYSKKKIRENIDAEIFGVCLSEARQKHHNILEIDVSRKVKREKLVEQILQKRTKKNNSI